MDRKLLFIISSAVYITNNPLCYTGNRSSYTAEERARQTLETIMSIRRNLPEAKILLIEMGLKKKLPYNMEDMVDKYLYIGNKKIVRSAADGPFKGFAESLGLYLADRAIRSMDADYYFKLSGRYFLNNEFSINDWMGDGYTGRGFNGVFYTVLYGFPKRLYDNWRYALKQSFPGLSRGEAIENALARYFEQPVFYHEKIGASGWIAPFKEFISL